MLPDMLCSLCFVVPKIRISDGSNHMQLSYKMDMLLCLEKLGLRSLSVLGIVLFWVLWGR